MPNVGLQFNTMLVYDKDNNAAEAEVAKCVHCDCTEFCVFRIKDQAHFHLQCARCDVSYCPQGGC